MQDPAAVVGAATTGFSRAATGRTRLDLAVSAGRAAIAAAGLTTGDVDGIVGIAPPTYEVQAALEIPEVHWWTNTPFKGGFAQAFVEAIHAIHAGTATNVLAYHTVLRHRERPPDRSDPAWAPTAYAEQAARYLDKFGATRADFGLVAMNSRSHAVANPGAAFREPLALAGYEAARMIQWPLGLLDLDAPVDGADAFVLTSPARARDLPGRAVAVHAMAGATIHPDSERGLEAVCSRLRAHSDLWLSDVDVYYPYDGLSFLACRWAEATGWCGPGEAGDFFRSHWVKATNRVLIDGRVPLNTHGGSLSEGGSQGSGHLREAVVQLQGRAGDRQIPGVRTALVTPGGLFVNAHGFVLRTL